MRKIEQFSFIVILAVGICRGQGSGAGPAPTNIPGAEYPRINSNSTITFRLQAEQAQKVQLSLGFGQSTYDMSKGGDGVWEVTTKPLAPGFYYYGISVDGFIANDPGSRTFFAAKKEVSGLEVPGAESEFFAIKDVPHGTVRIEWYVSKTTRQARRIFVYTPPGYDQTTSRYPVLYLQHGYGEDEAGWSDQGHENFILDNLIAAHKATPMIIVNENGLPGPDFHPPGPPRPGEKPPPIGDGARYFMNDKYATFDSVVSNDSISLIDRRYRTVADREHRAIAGLSMGGAQALRIGFNHLDQFAYIGAFSPAINITDTTKDYDGVLSNPKELNQELRLLWLGIGREDFLFEPVKESHDTLQKAGIRHVWVESSGAHVWTVWRKYLADFAPRLFR